MYFCHSIFIFNLTYHLRTIIKINPHHKRYNLLKAVILTCILILSIQNRIIAENNYSTIKIAFDRLLESPGMENAIFGVSFINAENGEKVFSFQDKINLIPASLTKLVTTSAAFLQNGKDFRFKTNLGYTGIIKENILYGDLVIEGNYDPTPGSKYFDISIDSILENWCEKFLSKGINQVIGNICVSAPGKTEAIPSKWLWEDIGNYYGSGIYSTNISDNIFYLHYKKTSSGETAKINFTEPKETGLTFDIQAVAANRKSDSSYIFGTPWEASRVVKGEIPSGKKDHYIKGALPNPDIRFGEMLADKLRKKGIRINGKVIRSSYRDITQILCSHHSPSLTKIAKITNYESVNLMAEAMFMSIYPEADNRNIISKKITEIFSLNDIETSLQLYDGSGLTPFNRISVSTLTSLLSHYDLTGVLPACGKEGTVKFFLVNPFLPGKLYLKSGSMTGVRGYAGYYPENNMVICILVNGFSCSQETLIRYLEQFLLKSFEK